MTEDGRTDSIMRKQMALILGRERVNFETDDEDLSTLISNTQLSEQFKLVARELDVVEPKLPEDIYKSHLAETGARLRRGGDNHGAVDSARANLASTYVNAFVNAGSGHDKVCMCCLRIFAVCIEQQLTCFSW